ncbi:MAG: type II toxin-antitoxin system RelE/ParE family toxin [Ignavibacteria bacterium]|nr:type II toxin-antitoxin system RelE/ParE family toxin [Ignavibacteria bacterium]
MYKLGLSNKVIKELEKLDDTLYLRISNKIHSLENNPRPNGSIKLSGIEGYRIRIGDYRILYTINERTKEVVVYSFAHRKEVYKKH